MPDLSAVLAQPWTAPTNASCAPFSATCYFAARDLYLELNGSTPVGVIQSAVGGTVRERESDRENERHTNKRCERGCICVRVCRAHDEARVRADVPVCVFTCCQRCINQYLFVGVLTCTCTCTCPSCARPCRPFEGGCLKRRWLDARSLGAASSSTASARTRSPACSTQ